MTLTMDWWGLLFMLFGFLVAALVHELGHALAGRMLGATEAEIQFGNEADRAVTWRLGWLALRPGVPPGHIRLRVSGIGSYGSDSGLSRPLVQDIYAAASAMA